MASPQTRRVSVAALGRDAGHVGVQARRLEGRQVGDGPLPGLHLAEHELSQVDAERGPAAEAEVHHDQVRAVGGDEEIGRTGVTVRCRDGCLVELVEQGRERVECRFQPVAQREVERFLDERMLPEIGTGERRPDDAGEPAVGVDAGVRAPWTAVTRCATAGDAANRPSRYAARACVSTSHTAGRTGTRSNQSAAESSSRSRTAAARGVVRPGGSWLRRSDR